MNQTENNVIKLLSELIRLKNVEDQYKKLKKSKSKSNKKYYQKHREKILKQNKEMRDLYKSVKQNSY